MSEVAIDRGLPVGRLQDWLELGKPRVTTLVIFTSAIGLWLAPGTPPLWPSLAFLAATACLVGSANALNCWAERETDARMRRTWNRALPAGRLRPLPVLIFGALLGLAALVALYWLTNPLTCALGALALGSYVLLYTPLKRVSPWAILVGAVPGAIPPLMGWTAATGRTSQTAWLLFAILFVWQIPHFIAISIYLRDDYRRGGLRVLPLVKGEASARRHLFAWTVVLVVVSLLAWPRVAGTSYLVAASILGAGFLVIAGRGLARGGARGESGRSVFGYSLLYLTALIVALLLDAR